MDRPEWKISLRDRWSAAQPTKTVLLWACVASAVVTMVVGFTWGGWVTGGTARNVAASAADDAVAKRLAPMCVVWFTQDPSKDRKLKELKAMNAWETGDYVMKQGWATMPGEQGPESMVAEACAKLLVVINQASLK